MSDHTLELRVDGEQIDIEVEELTGLERMRMAAKAPDDMVEAAATGDDVRATPDIIEFLVDVTTSQTVLTEELLEDIPQDELVRVLSHATAYAFGDEPDEDVGEINGFNEDGTVDLDDWR